MAAFRLIVVAVADIEVVLVQEKAPIALEQIVVTFL